MAPFSRLIQMVLASPFGRVLYFGYRQWIRWNDFRLNIDTAHEGNDPLPENVAGEPTHRARHRDNILYGSVDYRNVRQAVRLLELQPDDVFYDIGCGKGRVLCVAARKRLKRVVGIELFDHLAEQARKNAARLRGRKTPIDVLCEDAAVADLSEGTVFYLFNPFGEGTLRDVLENLRRSLVQQPRKIRLWYHGPYYQHLLADSGWLEQCGSFTTLGGSEASLWRNRNFVSC